MTTAMVVIHSPELALTKLAIHTSLEWVLKRIKICQQIDRIIVCAHSSYKRAHRNEIIHSCKKFGCLAHFDEISKHDAIATRVISCALSHSVQDIIEVSAEHPLIDPSYLNLVFESAKGIYDTEKDYHVHTSDDLFFDGCCIDYYSRKALIRTYTYVMSDELSKTAGKQIRRYKEFTRIPSISVVPLMNVPCSNISFELTKESVEFMSHIFWTITKSENGPSILSVLKFLQEHTNHPIWETLPQTSPFLILRDVN